MYADSKNRSAIRSISSRRDDRTLGWKRRTGPDARRVVAYDENAGVALVLEGSHPLERDAVPDRDVRRRDVDAELDAQRPAERELLLEAAGGQEVDRVARQVSD